MREGSRRCIALALPTIEDCDSFAKCGQKEVMEKYYVDAMDKYYYCNTNQNNEYRY